MGLKYVVVGANGGAWSGYTHAILIESSSKYIAEDYGFHKIHEKCAKDHRLLNPYGDFTTGFSFDIFDYNGSDIHESCCGRLKHDAYIMDSVCLSK